MLPAVGQLSGAGIGRHRGHLLALTFSEGSCDSNQQCEKSFLFICLLGVVGRVGKLDSDFISTVL